MNINNHKSILVACALGILLALTGCKAANQAVDAGATAVKEGGEMAKKGAEAGADMAK